MRVLQQAIGDLVDILPWEVDVMIGSSARPAVETQLGPVLSDPNLTAYVTNVGRRLIPYAENPDLPFSFAVLDNDDVNAFALPGGPVYVTSGLLRVLQNEAQLAAVIGHEIGHATDRHGVKQMGVGTGASLLAELALGGRLDDQSIEMLSNLMLGVLTSGYSRHHEEKADEIGLKTMVKAGYNPIGAVQLMEMFDRLDGDDPGLIESWFTSHPASGERAAELQKRIESRYSPTGFLGAEEYQAAVHGKLPEPKLDVWDIKWVVFFGAGLAGLWWLYNFLKEKK